jgi:phosphopantetheinyl transferase
MPMVYQQNINPSTRLGVWHIKEEESFFTTHVSVQRSITHPHKRLQHLAGRFLLKELFPDFPYSLIRIADTRKPFLENEAYHFSISHCGDYAAVLVSSEMRVGVDVELISNKVDRVKHKFLSPAEQNIITDLSGADDDLNKTLLTCAWGIKESLYKWFGVGEVDFIEHLQINQLNLNGNTGTALCKILKAGQVNLLVHFLFFNGNCISWVVSHP